MKKTKLTRGQSIQKVYTDIYDPEYGHNVDIVVNISHDDSCGNGHNTFSITGSVYKSGKIRNERNALESGAIGNKIAKLIPELAHLARWHLCSTDGPLHYIANTLYWAKEIPKERDSYFLYIKDDEFDFNELIGIYTADECQRIESKYKNATFVRKMRGGAGARPSNLDNARACAIWPDATIEQLQDETQLLARLPKLMQEFQRDIENIGLVY